MRMNTRHRAFATLVIISILAGCATNKIYSAATPPSSTISEQEFRARFPLDDKFTESVLSDYDRVQSTLLEKSKQGARESVSILTADGRVHIGYDDFDSSGEESIKEIIDNYAAVQIAKTVCVQRTDEKMKCTQREPLHLGLIAVSKPHVSHVWSQDVFCEDQVPCRFIKIQVGSAESSVTTYDGYPLEPELSGHDYELLFTLPEYVPIFYKQTDHYHVGSTVTAFYLFQFDRPIDKIELPKENESIPRD